ncbi:hypothetical protein Ddye_008306 [Dipteronia dyeriana]|uniref:Reverse transcriptase n=1 Tax=Dipteronia dyeriana TaxID=168575 RepID=A0AAE0CL86_9ROSI|nr:hypothetical protein Ddye_008306 [Dipteronia dyeriana]
MSDHIESWGVIRQLENKLDELPVEEESYWKQRSKVEWLKEGVLNTKFFHWKALTRRARNKIRGLFDDRGVWCVEQSELKRVVVGYFSNLFSSESPHEDVVCCVLRSL